jgi:glucose/arabinose dehydrogenase
MNSTAMLFRFVRHSSAVALLVAWLFPLAVRAADAPQQNTLSDSEKRAGWKLLFDGQSTNGWRNYRKDKIGDGWKAQAGELTRVGGGAGDIVTAGQYDSFELSIEFKISKGGNSGIMFHVTEDGDAPWHTGPEIQVQDNVDGHDPQKAGWLYQLYKPEPMVDATRPAGEWNHVQLRVTPQQSEINMNGLRYARFVKGSPDWDKRVAASKFAKMPNFGKPTKGFISLQDHGNPVAFRNIKVRELKDGQVPNPIDGELAVKTTLAFPKLQWTGWNPEGDDGKPAPLRPILLTHAGDGSNRIFVPSQQGIIHVFENKPDVKQTKVFLDLSKKVVYKDTENEEGLLGMAFHPKYKENGQFFIFYNTTSAPHTTVVSRFRVSKDNPNQADAAFEEELLRVEHPYWNHKGGTIAFGPDGHLYIALGDGGAGNDPHGNGQNLGVLLGKILRIDVDHKSDGKNYAIPKDNPFVSKQKARPEIYAYGLRNVWRLAFDRGTGVLWAGDVGQNLWEEINLIVNGGNYGWSIREGKNPFGQKGADARADIVEPIWEYDHEVGKSITGGSVYRGKQVPALTGSYIYADYVTGKLWALKYDTAKKQVVGNYSIPSPQMPVISFGEDEQGEVYFTIVTPNGQGIFKFEPAAK